MRWLEVDKALVQSCWTVGRGVGVKSDSTKHSSEIPQRQSIPTANARHRWEGHVPMHSRNVIIAAPQMLELLGVARDKLARHLSSV